MEKRIDIINMLLEDCIMAYPLSTFIISLYKQYGERGWLTRKQLSGLYDKASKINGIPPGRLAALEALIRKMPVREKSDKPQNKPLFVKDNESGSLTDAILQKYPEHKRILFLKSKAEKQSLSNTEKDEIKRLYKLLIKRN